jgi:membrane associated rhomboid family serine protease
VSPKTQIHILTRLGGVARATFALLALMGAVWLGEAATGGSQVPSVLVRFGAMASSRVAGGEYWRLLSASFVHVGAAHLLMNGVALALFGPLAERLYGSVGMLLLFVASGAVGWAASMTFGEHAVAAGASGAILGVFSATGMAALRASGRIDPARRRAWLIQMGVLAAMQIGYGFVESNVDNAAHIGGMAAGLLVGLALPLPVLGQTGRVRTVVRSLLAYACAAFCAYGTWGAAVSIASPPLPYGSRARWRPIVDRNAGYSLSIPSGWRLDASTPQAWSAGDGVSAWLAFMAWVPEPGVSPSDVLGEYLVQRKEAAKGPSDATVEPRPDATIGGRRYVHAVLRYHSHGIPTVESVYVTRSGPMAYVLAYRADGPTFSADPGLPERVLGTLRTQL